MAAASSHLLSILALLFSTETKHLLFYFQFDTCVHPMNGWVFLMGVPALLIYNLFLFEETCEYFGLSGNYKTKCELSSTIPA